MRFLKGMLTGVVCLVMGCEPTRLESLEARETEVQSRAEQLAEARGIDLREATLVETRTDQGTRHQLHFRGLPVLGMGAKTAHGETSFTEARLEPGVVAETQPRLTQARAVTAALAALKDPTARLTATTLMLLPREETRRKAGAPSAASVRPTAEDFEQVVTGFTLIYRVELSTGDARPGWEQPWVAQVDARSGEVLRLDALRLDNEYRTVTGRGLYSGTRTFLTLYNTDDETYDLADLHGNEYHATFVTGGGASTTSSLYYSEDGAFGDGQRFLVGTSADTENGETAAVDAFDAVNMTWRFFDEILWRTGPNGTGRAVNLWIHYPMYGAGYIPSTGTPVLRVGYRSLLPDAQHSLTTMATTDVLAHELGHDFFGPAVWDNPASTDIGPSEQAALNEATGDIVGFLTELTRDAVRAGQPVSAINGMTPTPSHFNMGEETGVISRNILSPVFYEWFNGIGLEDPHDAAGPITRMFVLLAYGCQPMPSGGSWTEWHCPRVPEGFAGIGVTAAASIWARTVDALPPGSNFAAAIRLATGFGKTDDGPLGNQRRKAVAYAAAAVGIGSPPDNTPPTLSMTCRQVAQGIECTGNVSGAENAGRNARRPQLSVAGGAPIEVTLGQFTQVLPAASLGGGPQPVLLRAWDDWNNEATLTVTVNLDRTGPEGWVTRSGPPKQPTLFVAANDPAGISKVEFRDGTVLLATVLAPPFEATFNTSTWTDGTHSMVARVYDGFGNSTALSHALLVDNTPPAVTMTVGTSGPPFNVSASATDVGALVRATFKVDGVVFATRTGGPPYQGAYTPTDPLVHNLIVEVEDDFGNKGTTSQAAPLDKTPPVVTFSSQQGSNGNMSLTVGASDSCDIQYPFGLYVDGTLVGSATTPGYVLVIPSASVATGVHAFHALVSDRCGNTTQFQTTFTKVFTPPGISAVLRDDTQPKKPKFTVQCNDTEGVHRVEMREGGVLLQTDTTAPYEFVVDTTSRTDGSYTVLFQCFDIYGAWSSPESRTVTADNTGPSILGFTVYGAGRSYRVAVSNVSDLRGVKNVNLRGGLAFPAFNTTLTQAPWSYNFVFTTYVIKDNFPFWVTATDQWGNQTTQSYACYMDTATTQNKYLTCSSL